MFFVGLRDRPPENDGRPGGWSEKNKIEENAKSVIRKGSVL
jgi:hypothetical protein